MTLHFQRLQRLKWMFIQFYIGLTFDLIKNIFIRDFVIIYNYYLKNADKNTL